MSDVLIDRLRKRLANAPAQPWAYRPDKYDDWGFIRGPERDDLSIGPFRPIVAIGKDSMISEADISAHRAAKTDPYGPSALLIVEAVNALSDLLTTIEAQARRIEQLTLAMTRPVGMQDVRLAVGEGKLSPMDILNGANVEMRRRVDNSPPLPDTGLQA